MHWIAIHKHTNNGKYKGKYLHSVFLILVVITKFRESHDEVDQVVTTHEAVVLQRHSKSSKQACAKREASEVYGSCFQSRVRAQIVSHAANRRFYMTDRNSGEAHLRSDWSVLSRVGLPEIWNFPCVQLIIRQTRQRILSVFNSILNRIVLQSLLKLHFPAELYNY